MYFPIQASPSRIGASSLLLTESLPVSDLTDAHMSHFYFCGEPEAPTAVVGFELCGPDALLRSLVVSQEMRSRGIGKQLVSHAENEARALGVSNMYLLTTTAEPFFSSLGYVKADREQAPEGIRATREFSSICPASSAFMVKRL
jgi:amino-acid N-acetyltransferase